MIKVKEEQTTYLKKEKRYLIEFYNLVFRVSKWWEDCPQNDTMEADFEIAEKEEFEKLTDEEQEELTDFINELN